MAIRRVLARWPNRGDLIVADDRTGFLGRWARRKSEALRESPNQQPAEAAGIEIAEEATTIADSDLFAKPPDEARELAADIGRDQSLAAPAPVLSLEDAQSLTTDSDFRPFMARGVGGDVRNVAMKKLFSDPHFNVMDGLDIYIDDYSKADPIPEGMLRQMVGAKLLGLFDEKPEPLLEEETANISEADSPVEISAGGDIAPDPGCSTETADAPASEPAQLISSRHRPEESDSLCSSESQEHHVNIDLRLQQDYAARQPEAGRSGQ